MRVAVACDHAGYALKGDVINAITSHGDLAIDLGTGSSAPVDIPDFAENLGKMIIAGEADRGVLICGSGIGACIAANKIDGIYAGLCHDVYSAAQGVEHNNMNVMCLGARIIGPALVPGLVSAYLEARFSTEERFRRRVGKMLALEHTLLAKKKSE